MDQQTLKQLLEMQAELRAILDRLQLTKATLPAGAFRGLATAEDELGNALGKVCGGVDWGHESVTVRS